MTTTHLYFPTVSRAARLPLRVLAENRGLHIGTCSHPDPAYLSGARGQRLAKEFNSITPEVCLKWDTVRPAKRSFEFGPMNQLVAFAAQHNQAVHGHCLIWHAQNPEWLFTESDAGLALQMELHLMTVLQMYPQIKTWDVVNEAWGLKEWTPSVWLRLGYDYVETAYRLARRYAQPGQWLYYNSHFYQPGLWLLFVEELAKKSLLSGVGLQMHLDASPVDMGALRETMTTIRDLGINLRITEMDVRLPMAKRAPLSPAFLDVQASTFTAVLKMALDYPNFEGLTVWGADDGLSWVNSTYPGSGAATLFDEAGNDKPAALAVAELLGGAK